MLPLLLLLLGGGAVGLLLQDVAVLRKLPIEASEYCYILQRFQQDMHTPHVRNFEYSWRLGAGRTNI
jgi:hypothetical protein